MFKIAPYVAAKWVEARWKSLDLHPLRNVINDVLTAELRSNSRRDISDEEIAELSEFLVKPVAEALEGISADYIQQGVNPSFVIDSSDMYYSCLPSPELDLRSRLTSMSPKGFEHFCKRILQQLMGHATVSGGTNDQCVDFFAVGLPLAGTMGPFPSTSRLVVIGQAKRWKCDAEIHESALREFVGAATLRADDLRRNYADRFGLLTPVSFAYWVTCDFSLNARQFAEKIGLWYLNGKALSQLALRIGINETHLAEIEAEAAIKSTP